MSQSPLLSLNHLSAAFDTEEGVVSAVDDVSFNLTSGSTLGLVGESGCGKSVTALSIMRLLPKPAGRITAGSILYRGDDLLKLPPDQMRGVRGKHIAMIFQEPMTALNPVHKIGSQLSEIYRLHSPQFDQSRIRRESINMLRKVGIPAPSARLDEYPHQISGGMRQRVMIAMALCAEPDILIADEPTTALDVTIQAQILDLIKSLMHENDMAVLFITHDLGVISEICEEVVVMYAGKVAETAPVKVLFKSPRHPYTKGLLASIPRLDHPPKSFLVSIEGTVPGPLELPVGCRFQNRCSYAMPVCKNQHPALFRVDQHHQVSCHLYAPQGAGIPQR